MDNPFHFALVLILTAAVLHAIWNAMIKGAADRALMMGVFNFGHGILGLVMVLLFLPPAIVSWPFIAASTFIHFFYYGFLILAYRYGDLSQVYPIARGVAPVMVALGAQVFANEILPLVAWAGLLLVSFGISILFLDRSGGKLSSKAVVAAVLTGFTIASYSIVDGMGVRVSQSPLGYIGWLFLLEAIAGFGFLFYRREALPNIKMSMVTIGLLGGLISAIGYGLAIYAKTLTTLGTVSAIRESSVIIAALIGVVWFGERPWKLRVISAAIVACGVILLATAG
ncbi:MAG: hypothetical protein COC23_01005 [Hyphomicrobiales bacterium]|nr:MAG: hypothetical protein COC23_01005 [Hyphomicrobiales bacterium]